MVANIEQHSDFDFIELYNMILLALFIKISNTVQIALWPIAC